MINAIHISILTNESYDTDENHESVFLTHSGQDKMAAIWQTTHSCAFSLMKIFEFRLIFN